MKTYEKPKLMVLSFTANDALCSGCDVKTRFDGALNSMFIIAFGDDGNGLFEPSDVPANAFGKEEDCAKKDSTYEAYCKFSGANQLFTS